MTDQSRRPWSPYRKDEVVVHLEPRYEPSAEEAEPDEPAEDEEESWDPVTKVEYLTALEETPPGDDLVLETRRQALDSAGPNT